MILINIRESDTVISQNRIELENSEDGASNLTVKTYKYSEISLRKL